MARRIYFLLTTLFFFTLPLHLTNEFRIEIGKFHVTINIIILFLVFVFNFLYQKNKIINNDDKSIFILFLLLIIYHIFSLLYSNELNLAYNYVVKISFAFLTFLAIYFVANNNFFNKNFIFYFNVFAISSAMLLLYYIVQNIIRGNSFLTFNYELGWENGKNQIQFYISVVFPFFLILNLWKNKTIKIITIVINLVAIVYVGSRGLWISLVFFFIFYFKRKKKNKYSLLFVFSFILFGFILFVNNTRNFYFFNIHHLYYKLHTLSNFNISDLSTLNILRKQLIDSSISYFFNSPILGNGLGFFERNNFYHELTHNDYLFFLSDLGLLGFLLFTLLIGLLYKKLYTKGLHLFLIPFLVNLLFINAYSTQIFWVLCSILLVYPKFNHKKMAK